MMGNGEGRHPGEEQHQVCDPGRVSSFRRREDWGWRVIYPFPARQSMSSLSPQWLTLTLVPSA